MPISLSEAEPRGYIAVGTGICSIARKFAFLKKEEKVDQELIPVQSRGSGPFLFRPVLNLSA